MDFHALSRRDLQALAKRNGIRANMTNGAMADALAALPAVDGIDEYVQQPVAEATPAAEPEVKEPAAEEEAAPEEEGEKQEVIVLDDSEEEEKDLTADQDEEKAPAPGVGRRRATRCARVEPVAAPATRKRAAASKAETGDAAAEAVPARATRGRSQRTVESVAEEEAPKGRQTSRRAVARKKSTEQEEEEKATQGDVSDMEAAMDAHNEEQNATVEEQSKEDEGDTKKGDAVAEAVPARATRGRRPRTVGPVAQEEAPKPRRTSRRAVASKTDTEQEEEEKGTQGDVSDVEADVPALVSSEVGGAGAEEMDVANDAHNEEQNEPVDEQSQEDEGETEKGDAAADAVPARATRARSQRTVKSVTQEEAPKTRRTSRRAPASKTGMRQEVEEKEAQRDVSDVEAAVPVPASLDEGSDGDEIAVDVDAQNEEQKQSQEDDGETQKGDAATEAVPARVTRTRRQRVVVSAAEEEAPKTRRTSRRAAACKTSTEQEQGEKATQGDDSDMEAAVHAPVSSTEGDDGAEDMEVAVDAKNENQLADAEAVPARATRTRRQRTVVSVAEEEAPKAKRPSRKAVARKTRTEQEEEEKATQGHVSHGKEAVRPPVSTDEEAGGTEEMEVDIDAQNEEQNELVVEQSPEEEGVVGEEEPLVAEDCTVDSSVEEQLVDVAIDAQNDQQNELVEEQSPEEEGVVAEEEPPVAEDSSAEEQLVDVQQCEDSPVVLGLDEQERGDTFHHDAEDTEMVPIDVVLQTPLKSDGPTAEVAFTSNVGHDSEEFEVQTSAEVHQSPDKAIDEHEEMAAEVVTNITDVSVEDMADHASEENEDCEVEEELPVAEDVDSSLPELPVDVKPCEATEEIHLAGEDTEMVAEVQQPMLDSGEATGGVDCTSDVAEESEEESPVAGHVDSSVQEPLFNVQQCEATQEIDLPTEDAEMVPVLESGEVTEEVDGSSDVAEESEEEPPVAEHVDSSVQEPLVDVQQCEATEEIHLVSEEMVPVLESGQATEEGYFTGDVGYGSEEIEAPTSGVMLQSTAKAVEENEVPASDEVLQSPAKAVEEIEVPTSDQVLQSPAKAIEENEDRDEYVEEEAVVATDEMPQAMDQDVVEVVTVENLSQGTVTDDEGVVKEPLVDVQQCEATEEIHLVSEEMVPVLESGQATEEGYFTGDVGYGSEEIEAPTSGVMLQSTAKAVEENEVPASDEVLQSPAKAVEEIEVPTSDQVLQSPAKAIEENEDRDEYVEEEAVVATDEMPQAMDQDVVEVVTVENLSQGTVTDDEGVVKEPLVDVQQCEATEEIHLVSEEMVPVLESGQATEEGYFTGDVGYGSEEIEAPTSGVMLQSTAKAVEENEVPASDEVLQSPAKAVEEIEVPTSDQVLQSPAKAIEENEDRDEYVEEEAVVATDEMPQAMDQDVVEVVTVENLSQGTVTDDEGVVKESDFTSDLTDVSMEEEAVVTTDEMPQCLATMDEGVKEEVFTIEILSQATVTCESSFSCDLEDQEVVAADGMTQSSATMEENVKEVATTVENMLQATVTDDEVKESGFMDVHVEEEGVVAADEIPHSLATMDEDVEEEVFTVSHTTLTDEESAVKDSVFSCALTVLSVDEEAVMAAECSATMNKDVAEMVTVDNLSQTTVADDEWAVKESPCTPVVDTARDFSNHISSPLSANVFEDATKSLSMDSITVKPMVSESADVPLCMYSSSSGEKNTSEPVAVQRENEPEAASFGGIMHSPLSTRKLRMAVAEENEADSVPPCVTIRKLRTNLNEKVAVEPMVSESGGVPLCMYSSSENASDPVEVTEGNQPEAASFGGIMHSPLSIRKLRTAVAQENEAASVCVTIRKLRTNVNEKAAVVAQENEVQEGEKSSVPLDKLSLRKLRTKLRETLNAHKNTEPKRVPLGRLDENAC